MFPFITLFCMFNFLNIDLIESSIDSHSGISYINTAEDLLSDGITDSGERVDIEHLFVLAAVVDPQLRNHAILGLASIERDTDFKHELLAMRTGNIQILAPQVIQSDSLNQETEKNTVIGICKTLSKIRKGQTIKVEEAEALSPWGYLFPDSLESFTTAQRQRVINNSLAHSTLKVERAILGGPTVWSADLSLTGGRPVALSINDDLASKFRVNPSHRIKRNGSWVEK